MKGLSDFEYPPPKQASRIHLFYKRILWCIAFSALPIYLFFPWNTLLVNNPSSATPFQGVCPQTDPLWPTNAVYDKITAVYSSPAFADSAIESLSGAVKIETVVFGGDEPASNDQQWGIFYSFAKYLKTTFPEVHKELTLTEINTHGLLYTWNGVNKVKPILFLAHQDVVPVAEGSLSEWKHGPFSGDVADGWIWGRGSLDDKARLIAILTSIETLLKQGFKPKRSVVLAFGFDEEIGGRRGALMISQHLEKYFGKMSFAFLMDEGGSMDEKDGQIFAIPGVGEKGALDVDIIVKTPGGHSSIPPPHTTIGYLAQIITRLEANPYKPRLTLQSPMFQYYQCVAEWAPKIDPSLKKDILASATDPAALARVEAEIFKGDGMEALMTRVLLSTTQAVDIIRGGIKANALPEDANVTINHRVSTDDNIDSLKERYIDFLSSFARETNMALKAFGESVVSGPPHRSIEIRKASVGQPAAPISPIDSRAFKLLSGTIRASYSDAHSSENIVIAPGMMTGNTDSRHYLNLTDHIFRYSHLRRVDAYNGAHTVNEAVSVQGYLDLIGFITNLILNADEAGGL